MASNFLSNIGRRVTNLSLLDNPTQADKNAAFQMKFSLPSHEGMQQSISAEISMSNNTGLHYHPGKLHLSEGFLCFDSPGSLLFTLPLYTIRRVERLHSKSYLFALSIATWHGLKIAIQFIGLKTSCEEFCNHLKNNLRAHLSDMKNLKPFLVTCYSEYLLGDRELGPPQVGLGQTFRYPGDSRKSRDKSKMRLWAEYYQTNGRNLTLVRNTTFSKLHRVGLPNRLRGELWDYDCGSMFLRFQNPNTYTSILAEHDGRTSLSIEEIEKDLNRSLPEYEGFQSPDGIERLRRVLTAFSWHNSDVGYCQAMNIVVAALLMFGILQFILI